MNGWIIARACAGGVSEFWCGRAYGNNKMAAVRFLREQDARQVIECLLGSSHYTVKLEQCRSSGGNWTPWGLMPSETGC